VLAVELVRRGARRHADRTAVLSGVESLTFRQVDEAAKTELWGPRLVQYHGQNEAPLVITVLDAADHADPALPAPAGTPRSTPRSR